MSIIIYHSSLLLLINIQCSLIIEILLLSRELITFLYVSLLIVICLTIYSSILLPQFHKKTGRQTFYTFYLQCFLQ